MQILNLFLGGSFRHLYFISAFCWYVLQLITVQFFLPVVKFFIKLAVNLLDNLFLFVKLKECPLHWFDTVGPVIQYDAVEDIVCIFRNAVVTTLLFDLNPKEILWLYFGILWIGLNNSGQFIEILGFEAVPVAIKILKQFLKSDHVLKKLSNFPNFYDCWIVHLIIVFILCPLVFPAGSFVSNPMKHLSNSALEVRKGFQFLEKVVKICKVLQDVWYGTLSLQQLLTIC